MEARVNIIFSIVSLAVVVHGSTCAAGQHFDSLTGGCRDCTPGFYQATSSSDTSCKVCPAGTFAAGNAAIQCNGCDAYSYQPATAASSCVPCPANTVRLPSTGSSLAALNGETFSECICQKGYFARDNAAGAACELCPSGAVCQGGTTAPVNKAGYWGDPTYPWQFDQCNPLAACLVGYECSGGRKGIRCTEVGHRYISFGGGVSRLPDAAGLRWLLIITALLAVISLWLLLNEACSSSATGCEALSVWIIHAQLISTISLFPLRWPDELQVVISLLRALTFDMGYIMSDDSGPSFEAAVYMQLLLPVAALGLYYLRYKVECYQLGGPEMVSWGRSVVATSLCAMHLSYNSLVVRSLQTMLCWDLPGGGNVLYYAPAITCWSSQHWPLFVAGVAGLVIFGLGWPFVLVTVLRRGIGENVLIDATFASSYGWLYRHYEYEWLWWETMLVFRRSALAVLILFPSHPILQASGGLVVLLLAAGSHLYAHPFTSNAVDVLESMSMLTAMVFCYSGVCFHSSEFENSYETFFWILLHTLFVLFFLMSCMVFASAFQISGSSYAAMLKIKQDIYDLVLQKAISYEELDLLEPPTKTARLTREERERMGIAHSLHDAIKGPMLRTWAHHPHQTTEALLLYPQVERDISVALDFEGATSSYTRTVESDIWRRLSTALPSLIDWVAQAKQPARETLKEIMKDLERFLEEQQRKSEVLKGLSSRAQLYSPGSAEAPQEAPQEARQQAQFIGHILHWQDHASFLKWMTEADQPELDQLVELLHSIMAVNQMAAVGLSMSRIHPLTDHATTQTSELAGAPTGDANLAATEQSIEEGQKVSQGVQKEHSDTVGVVSSGAQALPTQSIQKASTHEIVQETLVQEPLKSSQKTHELEVATSAPEAMPLERAQQGTLVTTPTFGKATPTATAEQITAMTPPPDYSNVSPYGSTPSRQFLLEQQLALLEQHDDSDSSDSSSELDRGAVAVRGEKIDDRTPTTQIQQQERLSREQRTLSKMQEDEILRLRDEIAVKEEAIAESIKVKEAQRLEKEQNEQQLKKQQEEEEELQRRVKGEVARRAQQDEAIRREVERRFSHQQRQSPRREREQPEGCESSRAPSPSDLAARMRRNDLAIEAATFVNSGELPSLKEKEKALAQLEKERAVLHVAEQTAKAQAEEEAKARVKAENVAKDALKAKELAEAQALAQAQGEAAMRMQQALQERELAEMRGRLRHAEQRLASNVEPGATWSPSQQPQRVPPLPVHLAGQAQSPVPPPLPVHLQRQQQLLQQRMKHSLPAGMDSAHSTMQGDHRALQSNKSSLHSNNSTAQQLSLHQQPQQIQQQLPAQTPQWQQPQYHQQHVR